MSLLREYSNSDLERIVAKCDTILDSKFSLREEIQDAELTKSVAVKELNRRKK